MPIPSDQVSLLDQPRAKPVPANRSCPNHDLCISDVGYSWDHYQPSLLGRNALHPAAILSTVLAQPVKLSTIIKPAVLRTYTKPRPCTRNLETLEPSVDGQATTNGTHASQWETPLESCICKLIQKPKRVPIKTQRQAAQMHFCLACERVGSGFETGMTNSAVEISQQASVSFIIK